MRILRLAYVAEFLIALIAVYVLWEEVGGAVHLEMIPGHIKLFLGAGAALACVKATAAAVAHDRAWNRRSIRWTGILLALLLACGMVTYYYHLLEVEEDSGEEPEITAARVLAPEGTVLHLSQVRQSPPAGAFGAHLGH